MMVGDDDGSGWLLEEEELALQEISLLDTTTPAIPPSLVGAATKNKEAQEPNCVMALIAWALGRIAASFRRSKTAAPACPYEEEGGG
jgi:hypothetical protein